MAKATGPRGAQLPPHSMFPNDFMVGRTVGSSNDVRPARDPASPSPLIPTEDASSTMMSMDPVTPGRWDESASDPPAADPAA